MQAAFTGLLGLARGAIAAAPAAPPVPVLRGCCLPACLLAGLLNSVVHIVIIIASCLAARQ